MWYEAANPYDVVDFKDVQFEVREDHRDFAEISEALRQENYGYEEDYDSSEAFEDEDITVQENNGKNETERPAQKIGRERQKIYKDADNGDIKPEGVYFFYNFFNLIGSAAMFIALVCLCWLIYLVVGLVNGPSTGEDRPMLQRDRQHPNMYANMNAQGSRQINFPNAGRPASHYSG